MKTLLTAKWVAPMDQPMIRDGGVVFEAGRILGLGTSKDLRARHPDAQVKDAGECVMLPGLVNAHVHLELSDQRAEERWTGTFVEWLGERIRSRAQLSPAQLPAAIEAAGAEAFARGDFLAAATGRGARAFGLARGARISVVTRSPPVRSCVTAAPGPRSP